MTNPRILTPLAIAASAMAILPATASARSSYCSASGDVCYGVVKGSSPVKLRIVTAAKYFSRFRLCITAPNGQRDCKRFRIRKRKSGVYARTITVAKHFEYGGKGTYRARFRANGSSLGPRIKF